MRAAFEVVNESVVYADEEIEKWVFDWPVIRFRLMMRFSS
jgi:hypothetical protein